MSHQARPIVLLATEKGRTFPETGLVVLRENHKVIGRRREPGSEWSSRDIEAVRTYSHESVHFLQSLTCGYLMHNALRYVDACNRVLKAPAEPNSSSRDRIAEYRDSTWDRAHQPGTRVDVKEVQGGTIVSPVAAHHTISVADILEGVADLAAFQGTTRNATAEDYGRDLNARYAGPGGAEYWNTFEHLASEIGADDAYACLCPLSFAALNAADPASMFTTLVERVKMNGSNPRGTCRDLEALFDLSGGKLENHFVFRFEDLKGAQQHPTLTPCLGYALERMPPRTLLEYAANPASLEAAPDEHRKALHPAVIVLSSDRGGKVTTLPTGLATADRNFAQTMIHYTALCGAAERLLFPTQTRYQFCPHNECEHYEAALCFRYFTPPSMERGHGQCQFPVSFELVAQTSPKAAWAAIGFERKSVDELVADFERTGEAGLLALVRRQKATIISWLGRDGFEDLEWKCEETVKRAMKAIQTNKMNDLIEARAFRDAVVREVVKRAARPPE